MTQNQAILKHLRERPITPMAALKLYGCFRLAARVAELRQSGHAIATERVRHPEGKTFARYRLTKVG
jgi:hypothetical protein